MNEWPTHTELDKRIHGWRRLGALVIDGARHVRDARRELPPLKRTPPPEPEPERNHEGSTP